MPTAILSVHDKTGIVEFAQGLAALRWTLLASGVTLVCDPSDYNNILSALQSGETPFATRKRLAVKGFQATAHYDAMISGYLNHD